MSNHVADLSACGPASIFIEDCACGRMEEGPYRIIPTYNLDLERTLMILEKATQRIRTMLEAQKDEERKYLSKEHPDGRDEVVQSP